MKTIKLYITPEKASAGPPIGAMLGQFGVNIMQFCKDFNNKSSIYNNAILLNIKIYVLKDGSYHYTISIPTLTYFLRKVSFQNTISIRWVYEIAKIQKIHIDHYKNVPILSIVKNIIGTINVVHKYKIIL